MRSKLTETTQATIRAALEAGNVRAAAALAAGITSETPKPLRIALNAPEAYS